MKRLIFLLAVCLAPAAAYANEAECLFRRPRHVYVQPQPQPDRDPAPQPLASPPPAPRFRPGAPVGLLLALGAAGVALGIAEQWRKTHPRM